MKVGAPIEGFASNGQFFGDDGFIGFAVAGFRICAILVSTLDNLVVIFFVAQLGQKGSHFLVGRQAFFKDGMHFIMHIFELVALKFEIHDADKFTGTTGIGDMAGAAVFISDLERFGDAVMGVTTKNGVHAGDFVGHFNVHIHTRMGDQHDGVRVVFGADFLDEIAHVWNAQAK